MKKKALAIVIINYNDFETTKRLIDNIKDYKVLDLIVVVDNHSTDDSLINLKRIKQNNLVIVENPDSNNHGYARGLNIGAKFVEESLGECNIIFSNSDIIIDSENDLKLLSSKLGKYSIAVLGPTVVEGGNLNRGWKPSNITSEILFNIPLISRYFKKKRLFYKKEYYKEELSIVGAVSGSFFLVDGGVLKKIDYFDEQTFLYYEENILAKRLEKVGKQIAIDNTIKIVHDHSVTIDKSVRRIRKQEIILESQKYFVKEYLKANGFQLFLLKITKNLSMISLYIRVMLKGGLKK